ncbi:MAG: Kazal-type serine protease inhibitor domain protein [Nitrosospira sp.]|nr:Kazal-type serine protease inhibitor domain protein [Nitrosospira sp.]
MKQMRAMGGFAALIGLWAALGPAEFIPASQAEPMKPSKMIKTEYQYAAKVVCSLLLPHQDGTLARGTYRTTVNIHNPTNKKISIAAKVALATQFGSEPGPFGVTPFKEAVLHPDGAVGISCFDIAGYFCPIDGVCVDFAFLEGFLVIKSPVALDVVGVYTARHTDGEVESIDVEAVQPRQIRETVKIGAAEPTEPGGGKRIDYPPKNSPAYGNKEPKEMCGGIAGFPCPAGKTCVDDPSDDCDPARGGADCPGICVK